MTCILIAGQMGVGKTTVAEILAQRIHATRVSVRAALVEVLNLGSAGTDRRTLQEEGERLDRRTQGRWLADYLSERLELDQSLIVDSVRTKRQCVPVLDRVAGSILVYLDAEIETRRARFNESARSDPVKQSMAFDRASRYATEDEVVHLKPIAQLVLPTGSMTAAETVGEIVRGLNLEPTPTIPT